MHSKPIGRGVDHSLSSESRLDELDVLWFALFANSRILFSSPEIIQRKIPLLLFLPDLHV